MSQAAHLEVNKTIQALLFLLLVIINRNHNDDIIDAYKYAQSK